jgi:hypothetical protein
MTTALIPEKARATENHGGKLAGEEPRPCRFETMPSRPLGFLAGRPGLQTHLRTADDVGRT